MTKLKTHLSIIYQFQVTISLLLYGGRGTGRHSDSKKFRSILEIAPGDKKIVV